MPIEYHIDPQQRLVSARGLGVFSDADIFTYQREVWSLPLVKGFDELVDMSLVESIAPRMPTGPRIQQLASESAAADDPSVATKFAIVAPSPLAYGLARELQSYRELEPSSTKQIGVFRNLEGAIEFLGKRPSQDAEYRRVGE